MVYLLIRLGGGTALAMIFADVCDTFIVAADDSLAVGTVTETLSVPAETTTFSADTTAQPFEVPGC